MVIRATAILTLKGNFRLRITEPDRICSDGVYNYIRHPSYLGTLFVMAGLSVNTNSFFPIMFLSLMFFVDRIHAEERMMYDAFKEEYIKYFNRTKMLIPFVI